MSFSTLQYVYPVKSSYLLRSKQSGNFIITFINVMTIRNKFLALHISKPAFFPLCINIMIYIHML